MPEIETLASKTVYQSRWMSLQEDKVRFSSGHQDIFVVAERRDYVVVVALDADKRLQLVQQYRYPLGLRTWEFPMGAFEDGIDSNPIELARRELLEETGQLASELKAIGNLATAGAFMRQNFDVVFATGLTAGEAALDAEEHGLIARSFPVAEVEQMIQSGAIRDSQSVAAFGLARMQGLI